MMEAKTEECRLDSDTWTPAMGWRKNSIRMGNLEVYINNSG